MDLELRVCKICEGITLAKPFKKAEMKEAQSCLSGSGLIDTCSLPLVQLCSVDMMVKCTGPEAKEYQGLSAADVGIGKYASYGTPISPPESFEVYIDPELGKSLPKYVKPFSSRNSYSHPK